MYAYYFNGNFLSIQGQINNPYYKTKLAVGSDGTVFLAKTGVGLAAYSYDGTTFTKLASIDNKGIEKDVTVGPDGTVFLANGDEGLMVYSFNSYVSIEDELTLFPKYFSLFQNYPNPFNPVTTISYQLSQSSNVSLSIYNINGQLVDTLLNEFQDAGIYQIKWGADNIKSGVYFYRIKVGEFVETKKCVLLY